MNLSQHHAGTLITIHLIGFQCFVFYMALGTIIIPWWVLSSFCRLQLNIFDGSTIIKLNIYIGSL